MSAIVTPVYIAYEGFETLAGDQCLETDKFLTQCIFSFGDEGIELQPNLMTTRLMWFL